MSGENCNPEPVRLNLMERDMAVVQHRLKEMERRHESVPTRVTKLEQQMEHMSEQLSELHEGQVLLTGSVTAMGNKIAWGMGVGGAVWAIVQFVGPSLFRGLMP